jgi:hypothetical protein
MLANILGSIQAPTTVTNTNNVAPLSLLSGLSNYASNNPNAIGSSLINSIGGYLTGTGGTPSFTDVNGNPINNTADLQAINNAGGLNDYISGYGTAPTNPDPIASGATQDSNGQYNNIDYSQI